MPTLNENLTSNKKKHRRPESVKKTIDGLCDQKLTFWNINLSTVKIIYLSTIVTSARSFNWKG